MKILGMGLPEIIFILLLILLIFGPADVEKTAKAIGNVWNRLTRSETWQVAQRLGYELRRWPARVMRESGLGDFYQDMPNPPIKAEEAGQADQESMPMGDRLGMSASQDEGEREN